jgi:hypothetical protein
MSTEGEIITNKTIGDSMIKVIHRWRNMNPVLKRSLYAYGGIASLTYLVYTYNDGREVLSRWYRENEGGMLKINDRTLKSPQEAAMYGCNYKRRIRLWESVVFPVSIVNQIVPYIVLRTTN